MRVVIAGAGLAGLRSAEAIRKAGFDGEITVVGTPTTAPRSPGVPSARSSRRRLRLVPP